jgi:DHA2 family metal-tetracycline-proton antiporter-like MFS transporter
LSDLTERQRKLIIALLASVVFVAVITGTMINVALPFIGRHFHVSEGAYGWIVTGYTLTFGIFSAIHGRLADVYGTRRLYLAGIVMFGVTAVFVSMSPTIGVAVALRIFQGAGAAALPALGTNIITRLMPPEQRGAAMGVLLGVVGLAASIGPFLGGILLELFGWRAVFLFTAVVLLALPFAIRLLPKSLDETDPQRFDVVGAALLGIGAGGLMYSFTLYASRGLGTALVLVVSLSVLSLAGFVVWIQHREEPFVRPALFRDARYVAGVVVAALVNATRFGTIVLVPILLVEVQSSSPLMVGAVLAPGALAIAILSPPAGRWADVVGARRPVVVGTVFVALAIIVTALSAGVSIWGITAGMTLYGLGFSLIQSPLMSATSQILPSAQTGVGLGMFLMIFFLGGGFGVAFTVTAVELQSHDAASWLGLDLGAGGPFSNAVLCLMALALISLALTPRLAGRHPTPRLSDSYEVPAIEAVSAG